MLVRASCERRALTLGMTLLAHAAEIARNDGIDKVVAYAELVRHGKRLSVDPPSTVDKGSSALMVGRHRSVKPASSPLISDEPSSEPSGA